MNTGDSNSDSQQSVAQVTLSTGVQQNEVLNADNRRAEKEKKTRASKREDRKPAEEYSETTQHKDQRLAKGRVENLVEKAEYLLTIPGVQLYLRVQVTSPRARIHFEKGEYFLMDGEADHQIIIRSDQLLRCIEHSIKTSMIRLHDADQLSLVASPAACSSKTVLPSPPKRVTAAKKLGCCQRCKADKVMRKTYEVETGWICCSYVDGKKKFCDASVHADCLGFAGASGDLINEMPSWFCKLHISDGRKLMNVKMHKVGENPVEYS